MPLLKKGNVVPALFAVGVLVGILVGCASRDARMGSLRLKTKDYEKLLEKQMATGRVQEKSRQKREEMTEEEHERLADTYFQAGQLERALVHYDKALRMDPEGTSIRYKMGLIFLAKGLNREAIEEFREVLRKEPDNAKAHEGVGLAQFKSGHKQAAEGQLRKALELDPKLWKAHTFLGIIYNYRNMPEAAIREHEAALALKPDEGAVYNNLGVSYAFVGDYENAVSAFEKALRTGTPDKRTYNNLGLVLSKLGRYEEAFEAFRLGGGEAQAYNNLGAVYLEQGQRDKAILFFEKAIELEPTYYAKANENLKKARETMHSGSSSNMNVESEFDLLHSYRNAEEDTNTREIGKQKSNLDRNGTNDNKAASENFEPQEESDPISNSVSLVGSYTVTVGSFRQRDRADRYVGQLEKQGLKPFRSQVDLPRKGRWYRVSIGHFPIAGRARVFASSLKQKGFDVFVTKIPGSR